MAKGLKETTASIIGTLGEALNESLREFLLKIHRTRAKGQVDLYGSRYFMTNTVSQWT